MPISRDEWNSGRTWETDEAKILRFLDEHKDSAFTDVEIFTGVGYQVPNDNLLVFGMSVIVFSNFRGKLVLLAKEGKIRARTVKKPIGEETYYTIV